MANKTVTVRPSGGDYTSLASAITGEVSANPDLTSAGMDGILTIEIQGTWNSADTSKVNVTGFTTDADHYIVIQTDSANRAGKSWDTNKYRLSYTHWSEALATIIPYTVVNGLQVENLSTLGNGNGIYVPSSYCTFLGCFVRGSGSGGAGFYLSSNSDCIFVNCISVRWTWGCFDLGNSEGNNIVYNCIAANGTIGFNLYQYRSQRLVNCYAGGCTTDYDTNGSTNTWITCHSSDGTGTTTTTAYSTTTGAMFTNITPGSEDFTLQAGSALIGAGTDLSTDTYYPFSTDIDGETRSGWDVGADEHVSSGVVANSYYYMMNQ